MPAAELAAAGARIRTAASAPAAPKRRLVAAFREQLEPQRARHRDRLHQLDRDLVAEPVGLAGRLADQRMGGLVESKIVIAERSGRDEAIGAGLVELDEQAAAHDAADAAGESRADLLAQEMRDQPVDRFSLRRHGAP